MNRTPGPLVTGLVLVLPVLGGAILFVSLRWLVLGGDLLTTTVDPAVIAGLGWAGQLLYVGHHTTQANGTIGQLRQDFGPANLLTILRGLLYAIVAGFVVVPPGTDLQWVPVLAYGTGVVFDKLDGTIARRFDRETRLGQRLDMAFDTFGFTAAGLLAVVWGQLPLWYLSVALAKYVYSAGLWYRKLRGKRVIEPGESSLRRVLAVSQMIFLTVALAPVAPRSLVFSIAPVVLAPFLLVFARDYLVASGRLQVENSGTGPIARLLGL